VEKAVTRFNSAFSAISISVQKLWKKQNLLKIKLPFRQSLLFHIKTNPVFHMLWIKSP